LEAAAVFVAIVMNIGFCSLGAEASRILAGIAACQWYLMI
jgi:hypothetical protein